jgi:putative transposase
MRTAEEYPTDLTDPQWPLLHPLFPAPKWQSGGPGRPPCDREGLIGLLTAYFSAGIQRLRKLWVDGGYSGEAVKTWVGALKQTHKIDLEVVERKGQGFQVLPRRGVVERTFAWLFQYRRHSKDYEVLSCNSEALIQIAMIHLLV